MKRKKKVTKKFKSGGLHERPLGNLKGILFCLQRHFLLSAVITGLGTSVSTTVTV
jgi:hypothetical protein